MSPCWRPADYYTTTVKYQSGNRNRRRSRNMCSSYPRPLLTRNGCPVQSDSAPRRVSGSDWSELAASCTCSLLESGFERTHQWSMQSHGEDLLLTSHLCFVYAISQSSLECPYPSRHLRLLHPAKSLLLALGSRSFPLQVFGSISIQQKIG
jgi:hypothetical protein